MALHRKEGIQFELNYSLSCTVHSKVSIIKTVKQCIELFLFPQFIRRVTFYFTLLVLGKDELHFDVSLRLF